MRACRLADIDFEEVKSPEDAGNVDMEKEIPGLPFWARGCFDALQENGEQIAFNPPVSVTSTVDRALIAQTFTDILNLPVPTNIGEFLTADVSATDPYAAAIAAMRATGCMDTVDGTNFGSDVDFNRAQNMVVSVCLSDYHDAVEQGVAE